MGISSSLQPLKSWPGVRASDKMAVDCRIARPMVRYLVYCVILAWPDCPSFLSISRRGMTTVSNCKMMLAVM